MTHPYDWGPTPKAFANYRKQIENLRAENEKLKADNAIYEHAYHNAVKDKLELDIIAGELRAKLERAMNIISEFVDWDGNTWRLTSDHRNDDSSKEAWFDLINQAEVIMEKSDD